MELTKKLIEHDVVLLKTEAASWQEAVSLGVNLLVKSGFVEPCYYDSIIKATMAIGPWYLISPGLAMPHGRPGDGVRKNAFSLVTLKNPVYLGDSNNDPIDILITLASTEAKTMNESSIVEVATLFDDEERVKRIRAATTKEAIKAIFSELDQEEVGL